MRVIKRDDVDRFARFIGERLGLQFDETKRHELLECLHERLHQTRTDEFGAYWLRLTTSPASRDELRAVAEALRVGETYFFRYAEHFRVVADVVLPERRRVRQRSRGLRILSAGCAT